MILLSRASWRKDGRSFKKHPVTGDDVPDDSARAMVFHYVNPKKATWPDANYVVGNPPFLGNWTMRTALGDGYAETLRTTYTELPESVDYVTFWWQRAAELVRSGALRRFGLITTNSIRQTFGRRVIQAHLDAKEPLSLVFAIPDHPWADETQGADVRIAMTVCAPGLKEGVLEWVVREEAVTDGELRVLFETRSGRINADLTIGANVTKAAALTANKGLCSPGVKLHGSGFIVTKEEASQLGLGHYPGIEQHIRHYRNGRDVNQKSRDVMVIDLFGLKVEKVQQQFPEIYQWILNRVKPERDVNKRETRKTNWWLFGETNPNLRQMLAGLSRYIVTTETSKHRYFVFLDSSILPDNMLVNIALHDAFFHGVLSSSIHVTWSLAAGGRLGVGNDPRYNKTRCFDPFPFPTCTEDQKEHIRQLAEWLDSHRKRQQSLCSTLKMTDIYNVIDKLRLGAPLTKEDMIVHEQGLVSVLKQIHDDLDAAVFDAYGWPHDLGDDDILLRLVELNRERGAEEKGGRIRWLRPEYQNPDGPHPAAATQTVLPIGASILEPPDVKADKRPWPKTLPEQAQSVRAALAENPAGLTADQLARLFLRANTKLVAELLQTLVSLGQARALSSGVYVGT
jgi:hypothetical protein